MPIDILPLTELTKKMLTKVAGLVEEREEMTDILSSFNKCKNDRIYKIATDMSALVATKNEAYNDSTRKTEAILEMLFPGGVPKEKMLDLVYIIPLINKICRISGNKNAFEENPYLDIIGYGLLAAERFNTQNFNETHEE